MNEKIEIKNVIDSLIEQLKDYAVRLAHSDALSAQKDKRIKDLEIENKQLREGQ